MNKISFETNGHIAHIQLNRPEKLNAIDRDMLDELAGIVEQVDGSIEVRVVMIRGGGERAFSVGADINEWSSLAPIDI